MGKKQKNVLIVTGIFLLFVNIFGVWFVFKKANGGFTVPLMTVHKGPTLIISGRVIFAQYQSGRIFILAKSLAKKDLLPDIAVEELPAPGPFVIKVPEEVGKIYLEAVNSHKSFNGYAFSPNLPHGSYSKNPINLKLANKEALEDIEIIISNKKSLYENSSPNK